MRKTVGKRVKAKTKAKISRFNYIANTYFRAMQCYFYWSLYGHLSTSPVLHFWQLHKTIFRNSHVSSLSESCDWMLPPFPPFPPLSSDSERQTGRADRRKYVIDGQRFCFLNTPPCVYYYFIMCAKHQVCLVA